MSRFLINVKTLNPKEEEWKGDVPKTARRGAILVADSALAGHFD